MERFIRRAFALAIETASALAEPAMALDDVAKRELKRWTHKTVKRATEDLIGFHFNTMVAALIEFTNALADMKSDAVLRSAEWRRAIETLTLLMAPATPFVAEEMWQALGKPFSVHQQDWPEFDPALAQDDEVEMIVQINGKVRDKIIVPAELPEERARELSLASERIQEHLAGAEPLRIIYIPGKLVNIVIKPG